MLITLFLLRMASEIMVSMPFAPIWAASFHGTEPLTNSCVHATALNMMRLVKSSEGQLLSVWLLPMSKLKKTLSPSPLGLRQISEPTRNHGGNEHTAHEIPAPLLNFSR